MTPVEQKKAAKAFVGRWKAAEDNEQREANSFWIELCSQVLGIANPTQRLDFERKVKGRRIDVFYEDMGILIESKSRGIDLDAPEQRGKDRHGNPRMVTPYEQARWYADHITPRSVAPKWVITTNFDLIRIYDLDDENCEDNYETLTLDELPNMIHPARPRGVQGDRLPHQERGARPGGHPEDGRKGHLHRCRGPQSALRRSRGLATRRSTSRFCGEA